MYQSAEGRKCDRMAEMRRQELVPRERVRCFSPDRGCARRARGEVATSITAGAAPVYGTNGTSGSGTSANAKVEVRRTERVAFGAPHAHSDTPAALLRLDCLLRNERGKASINEPRRKSAGSAIFLVAIVTAVLLVCLPSRGKEETDREDGLRVRAGVRIFRTGEISLC